MSARKRASVPAAPTPILEGVDASLLDIVDHVLTKGIVLTGDLVLGVADIDLVYLRLSAVLCAADRILGPSPDAKKRHPRHARTPSAFGTPVAGRMKGIAPTPRKRRAPLERP
jgi:hypothetical protein